jgi:hypothetical protein
MKIKLPTGIVGQPFHINEFNFIIDNGNLRGDEAAVFFNGEPVQILDDSATFADLFVAAGIFKSKSQFRKSKWGENLMIPEGWSDIERIGKLNKRITVLKPSPANLED